MEKIWIILFSEVWDYEDYRTPSIAFKDEAVALKALERLKKAIKENYADEIESEEMYCDEKKYCIDVYGEDYSRDHYFACLYCVDLQ